VAGGKHASSLSRGCGPRLRINSPGGGCTEEPIQFRPI
jgi:hypothetical protein